jgi:hypothetical protein
VNPEDHVVLLVISAQLQQKDLKNNDKEAQVINRQNVLTCNTLHHLVHHHNPPGTL